MTKWLLIGGGLAALLLAAVAAVQTARLETARTQLASEAQRADANAAVVARYEKDAEHYARVMGDFAGIVATLEGKFDESQAAIRRAQVTSVCADTPAARAYIDGLRARRAATADGRPAAAGRPGRAMSAGTRAGGR
jgi:hypothetical protein